jgi:hypothetical protein
MKREFLVVGSPFVLALLAIALAGLRGYGADDRAARRDAAKPTSNETSTLFVRENLVAWCIVPFDAKKRGPEERAAMLERMPLRASGCSFMRRAWVVIAVIGTTAAARKLDLT